MMFFKSDEGMLIYEIYELTKKDYDIKWTDAENLEGYIDSTTLFEMLADLYEMIKK